MGLNDRVSAERIHIGFFGLRNAGKSSVVNAVTGQKLSLVSDVKGTTTDPVQKAMEILPLGPTVIIDTPGIDDEGDLGAQRVKRAMRVIDKVDLALLVVDATRGITDADSELLRVFDKRKIPYIIAYNKCDLLAHRAKLAENEIYVSAENGEGIVQLREMLGRLVSEDKNTRVLVGDLINHGDVVVLVTPIDASAPKGRLILPQQQTIRDILDHGGITVTVRDTELETALTSLSVKPKLVITDSQAFGRVSKCVPDDIPLTSFSILFARYKGELETAVEGALKLKTLHDGDRILISEGCTHHRQCGDIGTVKLPRWIDEFVGGKVDFDFTSGGDFPEDLSPYSLIVHCGGCMLNEREMKSRLARAADFGVPMTNYGTAIAEIHGILARSLSPFPNLAKKYEK